MINPLLKGLIMFIRALVLSSILVGFVQADDFYFGVSTSEYQVSGEKGCPNANWVTWEEAGKTKSRSGGANEHYTNMDRDIQLIEDLGCNSYRFSVEWSLIEPKNGRFDQKAINHYKALLKKLKKKNITPMVTLHHFTTPRWFEELGGFENEENIHYFVRFAEKMFRALGADVDQFVTFNEPGVLAFMTYGMGEFPPGKAAHLNDCGALMKNLLIAHVQTYRTLKAINPNKQIGIVHQYIGFTPYSGWNPVESVLASYLDYTSHRALLNFFKTNQFSFYIPFVANQSYEVEKDEKIIDFLGLNYYSHPLVTMHLDITNPIQSSCYEGEKMTDMPFRMYPQGLYDALKDCQSLDVPLYVTETGIADEKDELRAEFITRVLASLDRAKADGIDVRGFYYWTLMDNFEWAEGYTKKFGLYEYNFETKEVTLRKGSEAYKEGIQDRQYLIHSN